MARWGLVATIKANATDILNFAAYHLDIGAHRLFLYLDAPCPDAMPFLRAHPKIRVILCDEAHWEKRRKTRPVKHQVRQSLNATRAYRSQAGKLDWLIHMDVDEFLWSRQAISYLLDGLAENVFCAQVRPIEALGGDATHFKAYIPNTSDRSAIVRRLYPQFGDHLRSGFLSHDQGKVFARPGFEDVKFRIHNAFRNEESSPDKVEMPDVDLCHLHGKNWADWSSQFRYRIDKGSYRSELAPNRKRELGGVTLHELLSMIEAEEGEAGLRNFYAEVCADSPTLRERLQHEGLLKNRVLKLEQKRQRQFPDFS